jgi:hypothetical protein
VTLAPQGIANLILGAAARTPQEGENSHEWYTLSLPEVGSDRPFDHWLWPREEELRVRMDVELHCVPSTREGPTVATFDLVGTPPTGRLEVRPCVTRV